MSKIAYTFKAHTSETDDKKIPPQMATILRVLEEIGGQVDREDLVKNLETVGEDGQNKLRARQPVERVVAFYQKRLVDGGYVEFHKEAAAPKEKAAKTDKAPKGKAKVPAAEEAAEDVAESMKV